MNIKEFKNQFENNIELLDIIESYIVFYNDENTDEITDDDIINYDFKKGVIIINNGEIIICVSEKDKKIAFDEKNNKKD